MSVIPTQSTSTKLPLETILKWILISDIDVACAEGIAILAILMRALWLDV